jgi:hypothetical protein
MLVAKEAFARTVSSMMNTDARLVSVPLVGTGFVQAPELSGVRSILHCILFVITFYFGFIRKLQTQASDRCAGVA